MPELPPLPPFLSLTYLIQQKHICFSHSCVGRIVVGKEEKQKCDRNQESVGWERAGQAVREVLYVSEAGSTLSTNTLPLSSPTTWQLFMPSSFTSTTFLLRLLPTPCRPSIFSLLQLCLLFFSPPFYFSLHCWTDMARRTRHRSCYTQLQAP
jgi:hypothetical protein